MATERAWAAVWPVVRWTAQCVFSIRLVLALYKKAAKIVADNIKMGSETELFLQFVSRFLFGSEVDFGNHFGSQCLPKSEGRGRGREGCLKS